MKRTLTAIMAVLIVALVLTGCNFEPTLVINSGENGTEGGGVIPYTPVPSNSESNYFSLFGTDADPYKEWRNMEDGTILGISYGGNYVRTDVWVSDGDTYKKSDSPFYFEDGNPESRNWWFANGQIGINDFYRKAMSVKKVDFYFTFYKNILC